MTEPEAEYGERLRRALHAAADSVVPSGDGLERIRSRIAHEQRGTASVSACSLTGSRSGRCGLQGRPALSAARHCGFHSRTVGCRLDRCNVEVRHVRAAESQPRLAAPAACDRRSRTRRSRGNHRDPSAAAKCRRAHHRAGAGDKPEAANRPSRDHPWVWQPWPAARQPGIGARQPRTRASQPDIRAAHPDIRAAHPDIRAAHPDIRAAHPDIRAAHPDIRAAHPDIRAAHPDIRAAHPDIRAAHPGTRE